MTTTFEPVTLVDVKNAIGKLLPLNALDQTLPRLAEQPARNTAAIVGLASMVFYVAERGRNPRVKDITDASLYCATCLNVGYADMHPVTRVGKLVGTFLQTIGPSLVTKVLDGPASAQRDELQSQILAKLTEILAELQKQGVAGVAGAPPQAAGNG
jgi:hypothetical protein